MRLAKIHEMKPEQLEEFLVELDLSNKDFARIIGVTIPALNHWLEGRRTIPYWLIKLIALFRRRPELLDEL